MIIDRTHLRWGIGTALASVAVTLVYLANNDPETLRKWHLEFPLPAWLGPVPPLRGNVGATPLGLVYGTVALLIFLFAALLGWRRNHQTAPVGRIQTWLKAHIWLTVFTIPLVLFHCGFHGGGPMTQFLLLLYAFVMVSGYWGLALQHLVPKLMKEYLPEEVIFEEMPFIRSQLVAQGESIRGELTGLLEEPAPVAEPGKGGTATLVANHRLAVGAVIHFIEGEGLPYLQARASKARRFALRDRQASDNQFRLLKLQVPSSIQPLVGQFQELCDEKRRLDLQTRLHYWLHGWLLVHAPASILLVVLTILHAIVATYLYS
jgi:hypothetical protein